MMANLAEEWESAAPINSEWEQATPVSKQEWDTAAPIEDAPMKKIIANMGAIEKFLVGAGSGFEKARLGAMQFGAEMLNKAGIASPETVDRLRKEYESNAKIMEPLKNESTAASAGEFAGEVAPYALIPGGVSGGIAKRVAGGAAAGAIQGAMQPLKTDESRLASAGTGAAVGGTIVPVTSLISKGVNAVKEPLTDNLSKLGKKMGVRLTLGEVTNNPLIQKTETWLEQLPIVGLKGFREKQAKEVETLGKTVLNNYVADPLAHDTMQANRAVTGRLYDNLNRIVKGIGNQEILPTETKTAAGNLLQEYPDIFKKFQDTKTEGLLQNIASGVEDATKKVPASTILGESGQPLIPASPTTINKTLTFDEAWKLRDGLGELIGQARKKIASGDVNKTQLAQLSEVYSAVNNDIENWATKIGRPDIKTAITTANDAYKKYIVKFDIIERAYAKATGEVGAGEIFSPKKFSTSLKDIIYKQKKGGSKLFSNDEIETLTGVANIMQVAKRAGQFMENPPTGNRWGIPVVAAEAAGYLLKGTPGAVATAGAMGTATGLARWLTGTESGKRFALAAAKVPSDSVAMKKILESAQRAATQYGMNRLK